MKQPPSAFPLIGRLCLSIPFIFSGIQKVFYWPRIEQEWSDAICNCQNLFHFLSCYSLVSWVPFILFFIMMSELVGGLLLLSRSWVGTGTLLLMTSLFITTILFHSFWNCSGKEYEAALQIFLKNIAIFGGLIFVLKGRGIVILR